jgi:hypothetical protein
MNKDEMKKLLENDLQRMSSYSVEEYTLYRKWEELNDEQWTREDLQKMWETNMSLWVPNKPDDYLLLEPQVVPVDNEKNSIIWNILRKCTSSAHWNQSPGRFGRFLILDKKTMSYLGVISIGSDFISLGGRDDYIGWTMKNKMEGKMLNHTCMGSSIVPTQPLGFNYTGGKLISLLTVSDVIENYWNERYAEKLVGISTTSLYGGLSQYNRLKYWHKCISTTGKIPIEPSEEVYDKIRDWVKTDYPDDYHKMTTHVNEGAIVSHSKPRILNFAYRVLKIKAIENEFSRGVYFCSLYDNFKEFLTGKDKVLSKKSFDNSVKALTLLWKERYAKNRIQSLIKDNRMTLTKLFYSDIIGKSWNSVKEKYLKEVGR